MMKTMGPNVNLGVGIVVSHGDQKDNKQQSLHSIYMPGDHSHQGVDINHLSQSPMSMAPTSFMQQSFPGMLDPGTPVLVLKSVGDPGGVILGQINSMLNPTQGGQGGTNLLQGNPIWDELKSRKTGVNIPPDVEETEENGVKVRKIKEKNEEHTFGLLEGLPLHGALMNMTGFKLPELKNIPTAKQTNDGMLNTDMLQDMMGQIMSLGQMFQGLMGNKGGGGGGGGFGNGNFSVSYAPMNDITSKLSPEMSAALNSMSKLSQGHQVANGVAFFTGSVVHEDTFLENAEQLLSQVQTMDDLMLALDTLQFDSSKMGLDKLKPIEFETKTAFGIVKQVLNYDGELEVVYDANTRNTINTYANSITSVSSSPGIGFGGGGGAGAGGGGGGSSGMNNMFGKSAQTMMDMMKRLHPEGEQTSKKLHEKVNQDEDANKLFEIIKKTLQGGNPIDPSMFK